MLDSRREAILHLLILSTVVLVVFGNSLLNGFVWDDKILLIDLPVYRDFDVWSILTKPANGLEYLPVRDLSYAVDYAIWGKNPFGFHLSNLILYCLNVTAVYLMTFNLCTYLAVEEEERPRQRRIALVASLLFAVHPLHCEAVSFITGRNILLSGLFFFCSIDFFVRYLKQNRYPFIGISLVLFLLALLSKATSIILPLALLPLALRCPRRRLPALSATMPYFALAAGAYFLFEAMGRKAGMINGSLARFGCWSLLVKTVVALQIPLFYLKKLLLPVELSVEYDPRFASTATSASFLVCAVTLLALTAAAIAARRDRSLYLFSLAWFLIALIPALNFFSTTPIVADRYTYLSTFGFCLALAVLTSSRQKGRAATGLGLALLLVCTWSWLSGVRNTVWRNNETLFCDAISKSPQAVYAYQTLGVEYLEVGDFIRAAQNFEMTKKIQPDTWYAEYCRGRISFDRGDYEAASKTLDGAASNYLPSVYYLGLCFEKLGKPAKALYCYRRVLLAPEIETVEGNIKEKARARLKVVALPYDDGLARLRKTVQANQRDVGSRIEFTLLLDQVGLVDEALVNYAALERMGFGNRQLYHNVATILMEKRQYLEAVPYLEKCLAESPDEGTLVSLGIAFRELHAYDKAIGLFARAMALDQGNAYHIGMMYFNLGEREQAVRYLRVARDSAPNLADIITFYLKQLE